MPTEPEVTPSTPPSPEPTPPTTPTPTPETPPAPEPVVPLTAESITFREGFQVDETVRDNFLTLLNDDKISRAELGQKLVDLQQDFVQKIMTDSDAALTKAWEDQQTQWQDEVRADPEVGGEKMEPVLGEIAKLVNEYGTPEVADILTNTGAGNNIHIVKMMHKIAKALNEGNGHANGAPPPSEKSAAQTLFPSMK